MNKISELITNLSRAIQSFLYSGKICMPKSIIGCNSLGWIHL